MMQQLEKGFILRLLTGKEIRIPKGTFVLFYFDPPRIKFYGIPIWLVWDKERREFQAIIAGKKHNLQYDRQNPPYPMLYFKQLIPHG